MASDRRARFAALQAAARDAKNAREHYGQALHARLGRHYRTYATKTEDRKLAQLDRAATRAADRFFAFLTSISPRDWNHGVPYNWLLDALTYDDATTRGPLSVVPPPSYGGYPGQNDALAAALPAHTDAPLFAEVTP